MEREDAGQRWGGGVYPEQADTNNRTPGEAPRTHEERDTDTAGLPPAVSLRLVGGLAIAENGLARREAAAEGWRVASETFRWRAASGAEASAAATNVSRRYHGVFFFVFFMLILVDERLWNMNS